MNCTLSPNTSELLSNNELSSTDQLFGATGRPQGIAPTITPGNATSSLIVKTIPCGRSASPTYNTDSLPEMTQVVQQNYTTVPMPVFKPSRSSSVADEEELYSSFEQAISERSQSLHLILTKTQHSQHGRKKLSNRQYHRSVGISVSSAHNLVAPQRSWQFTLLLLAFGLMGLLAGFDLMGLLILHMH